MGDREEGGRRPGAREAAIALGLGAAAVLASWIPVAGVVLGAAAVALALHARRAARRAGPVERRERVRGRRALGIGAFGLLLGLGFTVAWKACTPAVQTPAERDAWEEFDRAFDPPPAPEGAGGTGPAVPAGPRDPAAPPPAPR